MNGQTKQRDERVGPSLGRKLAVLRVAERLTQSELAALSGVRRASISEYEADLCTPDASTLQRILGALRCQWTALDLAGWFLARLENDARIPGEGQEPETLPGAASTLALRLSADVAAVSQTAASLGQLLARLQLSREEDSSGSSRSDGLQREADRQAAQEVWRQLRGQPQPEQLRIVRTAPAGAQWAVCECLCTEGQRLCGEDALKALALCELAVVAADLTAGEERWRSKLRAFAWAHVGNALRVQGDLEEADRAFVKSDALGRAGEGAAEGFLESGLVYALKASLRRTQRRFDEARELLDLAASFPASRPFRLQVLLGRAKLLDEIGELEEVEDLLLQAKANATNEDEPRALFVIWHNLADVLRKLERFEEAAEFLPEARRHCLATEGELNRARLMWTEGRIAIGLGSRDEGMAFLARVRGEFAARQMYYDVALVSLELAVIYAREGRTEQVKNLARHLVPIFQAKGIHREALAALTLFREAAERERITESLARDLLLFLRKARHDPGLAFEGRASGSAGSGLGSD